MGLNNKLHFRGNDFGNQDLKDAKSLQLTQDAVAADEAVRKSQSESISAAAVQAKLVSDSSNASTDTAFTSQSVVNFLAAKQDNLSIDAGSTAYLELNGSSLSVKQLLISDTSVDTVSTTLASWLIANPSSGLEEGDVLILTQAVTNQERSWIHNGGSAGTAADFTKLVTDYNEASIRAMISAGDTFISYDAGSGQYSLNLGTGSTEVGAQSLPANGALFSTVTGSTILDLLLALEVLVNQVDANATGGAVTIGNRLDTLSGTTTNNLGAFSGSTFTDNQSIKQVLQESEGKHETSDADRIAVRTEFASADAVISANLLAETNRSLSAEASEASARQASDISLQSQISQNASSISSEATTRAAADNSIDSRLDIIEGDSSTAGSIAYASNEAMTYTDSKIALEATSRQQQDAVLNGKIDNLAEGDITFVGELNADGTVSIRSARIAAGDTRNGQALISIDLEAGETFVVKEDLNFTYTDTSVVAYETGDKIMLVDDVATGTLVESKVNAVPANATGLSLINIGSPTVELDGNNQVAVVADSLSRTELAPSVEADIDDKRSLTMDNAMTSNADTHFVTDTTAGASQNMYYKRTSNTSDALTGTKRTQLAELFVGTAGSGDPLSPSFAHTGTWATFYTGISADMSVAIGGGNFESNVVNANSAVYATGVYALAQSPQLGVNTAVTGVAQNAGISNIGITGFGQAGGVGKDRGGIFALSDYDFLTWAAFRSTSPISYPDVALIADAGTAGSGKAFVSIGDSIFEGGTVTVPNAGSDTEAVNLGDIKAKEFCTEVSISATNSVVINHNLGSKKLILNLWLDDEEVTSSFDIERTSDNSITIYNATTVAVVDLGLCIMRLSV